MAECAKAEAFADELEHLNDGCDRRERGAHIIRSACKRIRELATLEREETSPTSSCTHTDKRSVNGTPGGDGEPIFGGPPKKDDEPAWCAQCGALWCQSLFGWGWMHPRVNRDAPTLGNLLADMQKTKH